MSNPEADIKLLLTRTLAVFSAIYPKLSDDDQKEYARKVDNLLILAFIPPLPPALAANKENAERIMSRANIVNEKVQSNFALLSKLDKTLAYDYIKQLLVRSVASGIQPELPQNIGETRAKLARLSKSSKNLSVNLNYCVMQLTQNLRDAMRSDTPEWTSRYLTGAAIHLNILAEAKPTIIADNTANWIEQLRNITQRVLAANELTPIVKIAELMRMLGYIIPNMIAERLDINYRAASTEIKAAFNTQPNEHLSSQAKASPTISQCKPLLTTSTRQRRPNVVPLAPLTEGQLKSLREAYNRSSDADPDTNLVPNP